MKSSSEGEWCSSRLGDAFVRLSRTSDADAGPLLKVLSINNDGTLHDGALRAVAMLRMRFNDAETRDIIRTVDASGSESRKFWLIAACPGWTGPEVDHFVERCLSSTREDVRAAAADAKLKKYRKWRPL